MIRTRSQNTRDSTENTNMNTYINAAGTDVSDMTDDDDKQYVYRNGFYKPINTDSTQDKENTTLQATNVPVNTNDNKALYEDCKFTETHDTSH